MQWFEEQGNLGVEKEMEVGFWNTCRRLRESWGVGMAGKKGLWGRNLGCN